MCGNKEYVIGNTKRVATHANIDDSVMHWTLQLKECDGNIVRWDMPGITLCTSENCPYKDKCYRVQAKSSKYQSWSNFEYTCNENSGFEDFIKYDGFSS